MLNMHKLPGCGAHTSGLPAWHPGRRSSGNGSLAFPPRRPWEMEAGRPSSAKFRLGDLEAAEALGCLLVLAQSSKPPQPTYQVTGRDLHPRLPKSCSSNCCTILMLPAVARLMLGLACSLEPLMDSNGVDLLCSVGCLSDKPRRPETPSTVETDCVFGVNLGTFGAATARAIMSEKRLTWISTAFALYNSI